MNINDTLLVTINLSDNPEESTVEIVTYLGQYRDIVNVFCGKDAELIYKSLLNINKNQLKAHLERVAKKENPPTLIQDLTFNDISEIENLSERKSEDNPNFTKVNNKSLSDMLADVTLMGPVLKSGLKAEDLKWVYANPALGRIITKEVDGETVYILEKENADDRTLEKSEVEA